MYICVCHGVTDTDIQDAMNRGIDAYDRIEAVLAIGSNCGSCVEAAKAFVESQQAERECSASLFYRVA